MHFSLSLSLCLSLCTRMYVCIYLFIYLSVYSAYQTTIQTHVTDVLMEWGSLYILLKDGRLNRLDELDTKTKLETLFKKNLYHTAIRYVYLSTCIYLY